MNNELDDFLEDLGKEEVPIPKPYPSKPKKSPKKVKVSNTSNTQETVQNSTVVLVEENEDRVKEKNDSNEEETSLISEELRRYELLVKEQFDVLDSIDTLKIMDVEERLKATKLKMDIQLKLPLLLKALEELRNKEKLKADNIRGSKDLSPLEEGLLD